MKKIFALFSLAAVCLLTGCSNLTYIFETDERLYNQTETGFEERFTTLDAKAAVYDGEYETFNITENFNIIAPIGDNSFVVTKNMDFMIGEYGGFSLHDFEYGIYTLGGEYRTLFSRYPNPMEETSETSNLFSTILYCNDEYILYYSEENNDYFQPDMHELIELHLLRLSDMTDKRIRVLERGEFTENAVICDNVVYFEQNFHDDTVGAYEGEYSESAIIRYDIETEELEKFCLNAGDPMIYKDKLAFYVGNGNFVSCAEPMFIPKEHGLTAKSLKIFPSDEMAYSYYTSTDDKNYTIIGYLKDGMPFNILKANDSISVYDIVFEDGCAVWDCNFFDWKSKMFPMFYSDKKNSVILIEDERAAYDSFIHNGKIYFFRKNQYFSGYDRALVLNIEDIK